MKNPTIEELQDTSQFELVAELNHNQIKEFVIQQLSKGGKLVRFYMIYQVLMILVGLFFITLSGIQWVQGETEPALYTSVALVFCFTLLIIIHELLHGLALKLVGAKKVNYGAYFKKFIFYAEADRFVINRRQFVVVALAPFIIIKVLTLLAVILFFSSPLAYFMIILMSAHSLFCAGDIGLLSIFYNFGDEAIYTYDEKSLKTSYYFKRKKDNI